MRAKQFSFRERANSLRYAWEEVRLFFSQEHNARIHLVATVAVFIAMGCFRVSRHEIIALIVVMGFVWAAEIFNTAVEKIMDFIEPGYHPSVKTIKDLSAAAVLVAAGTAIATGAFIFIPKIF